MDFEDSIPALRGEDGFFSPDAPIHICRAPGRLDLMGGNDDYTGGLVFESTIREATYAAVQTTAGSDIVLKNITAAAAGWSGDITVGLGSLSDEEVVRDIVNASPAVRWTAYVLGNVFYLKKKYPDRVTTGLRIYIASEVPLNRGVSSSAAVEVAVMKAAAAAWGIGLAGVELALACQWVENVICASACGIMDQVAVVTGRAGYVMPLVCQPCNPEPLIRLPESLKVWGIDSGVSHQVSGIEYEAARAAAFMGYKIICDRGGIPVSLDTAADIHRYTDPVWNGYLANMPLAQFTETGEPFLPMQMDKTSYLRDHGLHVDPHTPLRDGVVYNVRANTRYAVAENHRVQLFSELSRGAALTAAPRAFALMGELMYQSHYAYTDCGLGAEATDRLVSLCREQGPARGIFGAKITGGGAGGTVAILAHNDAGEVVRGILRVYAGLGLGEPYLFEGSSDGADSYGVVVLR